MRVVQHPTRVPSPPPGTVALARAPHAVSPFAPHAEQHCARNTRCSGNFAVVKKCTHKETGERYALKVIEKRRVDPKRRRAHQHSRPVPASTARLACRARNLWHA